MKPIGRIIVRETKGIRRFLYPLGAMIFPPLGCDCSSLGLMDPDGRAVPLQTIVQNQGGRRPVRLDFALSMGPQETCELRLCADAAETRIDDPLVIEAAVRYRCAQRRFATEFDHTGRLLQAVYDGKTYFRAPLSITRNAESAAPSGEPAFAAGHLSARMSAPGRYADSCVCSTALGLTACKSWATVTHFLSRPRPRDVVKYTLPFAVTAPVLTGDFGVGGGLYGVLKREGLTEIVWRTECNDDGSISWRIANSGREDFRGQIEDPAQYGPKRWFHLVDRDKALAVAVTDVPQSCRNLEITLRADGDTTIAFKLGDKAGPPALFGVCYHFLNDIPPLAAATNPQSILLPPQVEWECFAPEALSDSR